MDQNQKISRRSALANFTKGISGLAFGGLIWGVAIHKTNAKELVLRPPGALPENDFVKACLKCGQCVEACPYDTLKLSTAGDGIANGTPHFTARDIPCYMCTDYPCIKACPSKALDEKAISIDETNSINNAQIGLAVIHKESCIAFWGIQCDACYRACPLMGKAITLELEKNEVTQKHANLKPIINSDVCTGCGLCEHVCVVEKAAVKVLPRDVAVGEVGDHYIKSWDENDEQRLQNKKEPIKKDEDIESALDYLNDDEELIENE